MAGLISLHHVPTRHQLADVLTKSLPEPLHRDLVGKLGVQAPSNLRGVLEIELSFSRRFISLLQVIISLLH